MKHQRVTIPKSCTGYRDSIAHVIAKVGSDATPKAIEELMRVETGGCLDAVSRTRFASLAVNACLDWQTMDPDCRAFYATGEIR